tara:strand:- start:17954 stop:18112 length:159 start_codon:yes stop_codon:yes gene_type:complete
MPHKKKSIKRNTSQQPMVFSNVNLLGGSGKTKSVTHINVLGGTSKTRKVTLD